MKLSNNISRTGIYRNSSFFTNQSFILIIYIIAAISISYINIESGEKYFHGVKATHYNNYVVCKYSHLNLTDGKNIYAPHPSNYWDLYKYSPAFAVFMGLFAYLPDLIGLSIWNLLNALVLFIAIRCLPIDNRKKILMALWLLLPELITNLQYSQTNGMMAGLMLLSFNYMEKDNKALASLFLVLSIFIKIFGVALLPLVLFYPKKTRFLVYTFLWGALLVWLPLIIIPYEHFIFLYNEWLNLIAFDYSQVHGLSVIGIMNKFNFMFLPKNIMILLSAVVMYLPLAMFGRYKLPVFRMQYAAAVLIWVVIFNYRAESPTYIIAMAGASVWYFSQDKTAVNKFLLVLALIFTSFSVSDIFPQWLKEEYFRKYLIKTIPCILIWFKLMFDLYTRRWVIGAGV